jgi:hypothetical protein
MIPRVKPEGMLFPKTGFHPSGQSPWACFFGIMLFGWSMIFSENRLPLFGIML